MEQTDKANVAMKNLMQNKVFKGHKDKPNVKFIASELEKTERKYKLVT